MKTKVSFELFDDMYKNGVKEEFLLPFQIVVLDDLYKRSEIFFEPKKETFYVYVEVYKFCAALYNALYLLEKEELKLRPFTICKSNLILTEYAIERLNSMKDLLFRKDF